MVVLSWIHYLIRIDWVEETYNLNDWIESKKNPNYDLIKNYTEGSTIVSNHKCCRVSVGIKEYTEKEKTRG